MCTCLAHVRVELFEALHNQNPKAVVGGFKMLNTAGYTCEEFGEIRPALEVAYSLRYPGKGGAAEKHRKVVDFKFCPFCGKPYNDVTAADRRDTNY